MVDLTKEKEPVGGAERVKAPEEFPTVESPRSAEANVAGQNLEVESWITKIEKRFARIPKGQPGPQDDGVVVQQPASNQPPITLPVNQQQMVKGQDAPIETGIRWLVTWAIRRIKILTKLGRRVELASIPELGAKKEVGSDNPDNQKTQKAR